MHLPDDITLADTADGSPTLVFRRADGYVEKMHHSGGALSESRFIYGQALEIAAAEGRPVCALSIGLGLGSNELRTLATPGPARIWSFEALPFLSDEFRRWAEGDDAGALAATYDRIAAGVGGNVRVRTAHALREGHLQLRGPFPDDLGQIDQANLVYFDAYSNKMDPHLWDEDMLTEVFGRVLAPDCVLATYAATGALNRVLRRLGFTRVEKPGFLGKRQSTLGVRGAYAR